MKSLTRSATAYCAMLRCRQRRREGRTNGLSDTNIKTKEFNLMLRSPQILARGRRPHSSGGGMATFDGTATNVTLSNGNLTATQNANALAGARSTANKSSGKFYFELTVGSLTGFADGG